MRRKSKAGSAAAQGAVEHLAQLAGMVDHLTPPLAATPLYDQLLALRQVVETLSRLLDYNTCSITRT